MLLTCTNKGCMKSSDARLDATTMEVICLECGKVISNISDSMKRVLKSSGQIVRTDERKAFMMGCKKCNANRQVVLDAKNNTICSVCGESIKVHAAMKQALMLLKPEASEGLRVVKTDKTKVKPKQKNPKQGVVVNRVEKEETNTETQSSETKEGNV